MDQVGAELKGSKLEINPARTASTAIQSAGWRIFG